MNKGPITYSYWVIPEKVLAGEYPGNQMRKSGIFRVLRTLLDQSIAFCRHPLEGWPTDNKRVKKLLRAGITNYLDLTQSDELLPYEALLNREAELLGMVINYKRVPIKDQNITTSDEIAKCISFNDSWLLFGR